MRRVLGIFVVAASVLCAATGSAAAATRFVATNGSDEAGNTCLSSAEPCQTVQQAITQATPGDTVAIAAGAYLGKFQLNKELTLVGEGPATLLEGEPTVERPVFIQSNVALENLRIRGGLNGTLAQNAINLGAAGIHVSLNKVIAEQNPSATDGRNAVYVPQGTSLTMKDSTITGVGTTCLWVGGSATVTESLITMTPGARGGAAIRVIEGGTADLNGVAASVVATPEQTERGSALSAEGGTVTAIDSTFYGPRSVGVSKSTLSMIRVKITAHEAGLVLHDGAIAELRDSLIAPPTGETIGDDILTETGVVPVAPVLTIIGSTLYANGPARYSAARAIDAHSPIQARVVNTILRAVDGTGNAADIETSGGGTWSVTHSAYTTIFGSEIPAPGSGTNVAVAPVFPGQGAGNYQLIGANAALLAAGDPTQVTPGETDLAGQPRVLAAACNGAPDIGAYEELIRPNLCPSRSPGGIEQTSQSQEPFSPAALGLGVDARPTISGVKVKQRRRGPTLEFRLSEPATVTVSIFKAIRHRAGKREKTSYRSVARFTEEASKGRSVIPLTPRLGTLRAMPGVYRLSVIATANGLTSDRHTVSGFELDAR